MEVRPSDLGMVIRKRGDMARLYAAINYHELYWLAMHCTYPNSISCTSHSIAVDWWYAMHYASSWGIIKLLNWSLSWIPSSIIEHLLFKTFWDNHWSHGDKSLDQHSTSWQNLFSFPKKCATFVLHQFVTNCDMIQAIFLDVWICLKNISWMPPSIQV